jgi:hypothetical protein
MRDRVQLIESAARMSETIATAATTPDIPNQIAPAVTSGSFIRISIKPRCVNICVSSIAIASAASAAVKSDGTEVRASHFTTGTALVHLAPSSRGTMNSARQLRLTMMGTNTITIPETTFR